MRRGGTHERRCHGLHRRMSLKRNILANYASQIYVTLISIVMVPLYLRYMGAEAFGLVGFFATLQMWFNLLDMGLPQQWREKRHALGVERWMRSPSAAWEGTRMAFSDCRTVGRWCVAYSIRLGSYQLVECPTPASQ